MVLLQLQDGGAYCYKDSAQVLMYGFMKKATACAVSVQQLTARRCPMLLLSSQLVVLRVICKPSPLMCCIRILIIRNSNANDLHHTVVCDQLHASARLGTGMP